MPRATVIRLGIVLGAIVLLAGYFLGRQRTTPVTASAPPRTAAPAGVTSASVPASSEGATPAQALSSGGNLLRPTDDLKGWHMDLAWGGVGSLAVEDHVLHATVSRPGKKYWHVQFYQTPHGLKEGQAYTLTFQARADSPCDLPVGGSVNFGDYHPIGLTTHFALGRDWKTYSHTFVIHGMANDNNRLPVFMVGTKPHQYWLKDVVLRPGR